MLRAAGCKTKKNIHGENANHEHRPQCEEVEKVQKDCIVYPDLTLCNSKDELWTYDWKTHANPLNKSIQVTQVL
jgi:hypothetical protein